MSTSCAYCHLPLPTRAEASPADDARADYCCYGCRLAADITAGHGPEGHATWMLTRLGTAIVLSMAIMVFSLPLYGTDVYAAGAGVATDSATSHLPGVLRYASLLLTSIVFVLLGLPLAANAVGQLSRSVVTTDLLVVIGVVAALVYSYVATVKDSGRTYFETTCMVLVLVTIGRYLEATGKNRASSTLRELEALLPDEVTVVRDGRAAAAPRSEVRVGDLVMVTAGQCVPVDGEVVLGEAHVDERMVTGESEPIPKGPRDLVRAGSTDLDGPLTIRVSAVGARSTIGRLIDAVERARRDRGRYDRLADRVTRWFLPGVLLLALVGGIAAFARAGGEHAVLTSLAVLLISCPCALGIATPLAAYVAIDRATGRGVVFRGVTVMEALAGIHAVAFDKTGTLTDGEATVGSFIQVAGGDATREELLSAAGSLAATSGHGVSRGIARFVRDQGVSTSAPASSRIVPGRGVVATIRDRETRLGSPRFVAPDAGLPPDIGTETLGRTIACIGYGNRIAGVFTLREQLRPEADEALRALASLGCSTRILTGDNALRARQIEAELHVEARAELLPEEKLREISEMRRSLGPIAMVGDGLNDTPALSAADVGIAMGCGADVTREAADVCLIGNDLRGVPWSIALSRRAVGTMRWNLLWAFAYNAVGLPLAMTGRLNPVFAAVAMVVSSLVVVGNSLRLRRAALEVSLP